ncbi:hypothetical protein QUA13_24345 [Microcoleus sp. S28C3]|uniref:hypothetical protein n=1 Tax=Microcoleus sp. S28C3 TaxID=3055414 RepID=UPI002FD638CB
MGTNRPRTTISFDFDEYQELKDWADSEFRTIPQLVLVLVKKALIERREHADQTSDRTDSPQPTEAKPASAAKAKQGKASKGAS